MDKEPSYLKKQLDIKTPLIGVYDAPTAELFHPLIKPPLIGRACTFSFYKKWLEGKTLQLTENRYGCGGCGHWYWGKEHRSREDFIDFLVGEEGLKIDNKTMDKWLDYEKPYTAENKNIFIGPLKAEVWTYLKTVSFFVNPDQLSALITGAHYCTTPENPNPVKASFGSGCMEMLNLIQNENAEAIIGSTDIAMRQYIPADLIIFTVNKLMYKQLCKLDERSFLGKKFLQTLKRSRGGSI